MVEECSFFISGELRPVQFTQLDAQKEIEKIETAWNNQKY
jgi:hypothetical protein